MHVYIYIYIYLYISTDIDMYVYSERTTSSHKRHVSISRYQQVGHQGITSLVNKKSDGFCHTCLRAWCIVWLKRRQLTNSKGQMWQDNTCPSVCEQVVKFKMQLKIWRKRTASTLSCCSWQSTHVQVCLYACLFMSLLYVCLFMCVCVVHVCVNPSICLSIYLSIYIYIYLLSIYLGTSVFLSVSQTVVQSVIQTDRHIHLSSRSRH